MLARNDDCNDVLLSMQRMERRFNHKFQYPYVFLNDSPFDDNFHARCVSFLHLSHMLDTEDAAGILQDGAMPVAVTS